MALHPDGTVWATGANKEVRMLDPATGEFKFYEAPSAKAGKLPGSYGLAVAGEAGAAPLDRRAASGTAFLLHSHRVRVEFFRGFAVCTELGRGGRIYRQSWRPPQHLLFSRKSGKAGIG